MIPALHVNSTYSTQNANSNSKYLAEGSSALVRVISEKGNGKYEGSVAGVRITFSSKNPLKIGSTFVTTVTSQNGKIILVPQKESISILENPVIKQNDKALVNILNHLGIPNHEFSQYVLKQFKQLQLPFSQDKLFKILGTAIKHKGKEKKIIELLSLLQQKKISVSEAEILTYLEAWDNDFENDTQKKKDFINRFNSKEGSWYVLPYDLVEGEEQKIIGGGNIKIFMNRDNSLEKLNIHCSLNNVRFLFNLYFNEMKLQSIKFNISDLQQENSDFTIDKLNSLFNKNSEKSVSIQWADSEDLMSTECMDESFESVRGSV